ncbi:helix-turn-helix domain-containing protein [Flavobacterium sp. 2]|uniref:helix-turn-helix domain-containing protein n=1 Tax=Flavobacterium sp. 2 TaxID=308053 RepID=UPI003CF9E432
MRYDSIKVGQCIKSARTAKGLTQIQLAEASGISLRSIQRIENGEVEARSYTLGVLQEKLNFELNATHLKIESQSQYDKKNDIKNNRSKKIIYSYIGAGVIFIVSGFFLTMSASFPETNFELYTFMIATIAAYSLVLLLVWKNS